MRVEVRREGGSGAGEEGAREGRGEAGRKKGERTAGCDGDGSGSLGAEVGHDVEAEEDEDEGKPDLAEQADDRVVVL